MRSALKALTLLLVATSAAGATVVVTRVAAPRDVRPVQRPATAAPTLTPTVAPSASPSPTPAPVKRERPRGPRKLIEVSIERQELIAWEDDVARFRLTISTGRDGYETPTGRFKIHTKYDNRWSRKWKVWMPYAMFWHPKYGYAFHELPYKPGSTKRIGKSKLGTRDSHGCIRIDVGDAKMLYEWAPRGTEVWIH